MVTTQEVKAKAFELLWPFLLSQASKYNLKKLIGENNNSLVLRTSKVLKRKRNKLWVLQNFGCNPKQFPGHSFLGTVGPHRSAQKNLLAQVQEALYRAFTPRMRVRIS